LSQLELHLLGSPRLERDGTLVVIQRRKVMALLIYLAVTVQVHRRDSLATLFWPEHDQTSARGALRRTLSELQKVLEINLLRIEQDSIGLERSEDLWVDVWEVQTDLEAYHAHGHHPDDPCPDCIKALTEVVSLYKDDFLAGFSLNDSPEFDEWQILQAEILHRDLISALSRLVQCHSAGGEIDPAIEAARHWLVLDPVDETAHRHLMQLYTWRGECHKAVRQYRDCVRILERELGVTPHEETTRLYESIRAQKDFSPVEGIKAPIATRFPKSTVQQHKPNNLPVQLTSFVGRTGELSAVVEEISRPEVHLLTLTGPGGVGKTRLSLEVTTLILDQFEDGAFFVALAPIRDPALVGPTIAHVLGTHETQSKHPEEILKEFLHDKQLLLVLDNFEHLPKAAPLVTELLSAAPNLKVLVTSRTLLHVYGEHLYPILPMKLSKLGRKAQAESMVLPEALQLFVERARAVKSDFIISNENLQTLEEICDRLDGLPLAIELAAAGIRQISPQAMLRQWTGEDRGSPLKTLTGGPCDVPVRHKSLRNSIAWSYNLLGVSEQAVFRRAGIFEGGWTPEAAAKIIGEPLLDDNYPTSISSSGSAMAYRFESLVESNLIKRIELGEVIRFSMLETIREFAMERLAESDEVEILRRRHAEFFLSLAEMAKPNLRGSQQVVWVDRLEQDYENLRAALKWTIDSMETEMALRLGSALGRFWYTYDPIYWSEARMWLEQAINLKQPESININIRANALSEAGVLAWAQVDYDHATLCFEECLALRKISGDKAGIASALGNLGLVAREQLDLTRARAYQEECLILRRELDDMQGMATAFSNLGLVAADQGDYGYAITLFEESLVLNRKLENMTGLTLALHNLGGLLVENRGDYLRAMSVLKESLKLSRVIGRNFFLIPHTLNHLGNLYLNREDFKQARVYFEESLYLSRASDNKYATGNALHGLGRLAHHQEDYVKAQESYKESILVLREINGFVVIIWNIFSLADLACISGNPLKAAILLGASEKLLENTSTCLMQLRREEYEHITANTRIQLDETEFNRLWAKGRELSVDQTIEYALGEGKDISGLVI
jgi:predicted ATPase/DNA-binding SARP family transcriptional activator